MSAKPYYCEDSADLVIEPAYLYQCFCSHVGVLYVGITENLAERLRAHAKDKPWWPEVAFLGVDVFATRGAAKRAETVCITRSNGPVHNVAEKQANPWENYAHWPEYRGGFRLDPVGTLWRTHQGWLNPDRAGSLFTRTGVLVGLPV